MEHISAVGPVDVTAARFETFHTIRELTVVCSRSASMAATPLVVTVDEANLGCLSASADEVFHVLTFTPNDRVNQPRGAQRPEGPR